MTRERRLWLLGGTVALAAIIVAVAVAISQGGADDEEAAAPIGPLQQESVWLGDPDAPATLIEFADLQCPFCAQFATEQLPGLIEEYVRPGRVRLELRLLAFLGPDSARARQVAHATALQDRMWNFTERFFRNQGEENSGYATDEFLQRLARPISGLEVQQLSDDLDSAEAETLTREAERMAERLEVGGTPSFYLVRDGGEPEPIEIDQLDEALGGG